MFDIPLHVCFFTKENPLNTSNKRTHISLLINQFISLTELKMQRWIKFRTQSRSLEQRMIV